MKRSDFRFDLPAELIADYPCEQRCLSRLLRVPPQGTFADGIFRDVGELLQDGDLLVINDTRVIRARIPARKESGGRAEVLIERLLADNQALARVGTARPLREGTCLLVGEDRLRVLERRGELSLLQFEGRGRLCEWLERTGEVPLPPYVGRPAEAIDASRYQTVYAKHSGSVAAPTAGLHFDVPLLESLASKGVQIARLTLHIGAGTFQPLREEDVASNVLHREWLRVGARLCDAIAACRCRGQRIIAVGSTVVRALETACGCDGAVSPYEGETALFIRPGYRFRVADVIITNFHLPESSLFILVCAFAGRQRMLAAYRHAIRQRYRFFSYGDAMWLEKSDAVHD